MRKLTFALGLLTLVVASSFTLSSKLSVGDEAPVFNLKNIDGSMVDLESYQTKGAIVVFTCNHCPYAKAYEDRIIALHNKYKSSYPVIAINPNDAESYPSDSFEKMKDRAKDKGFTFPYLHDESQDIAHAYGALKTPHVYLLNKEDGKFIVKYIGAIDNNTNDASKANEKYVETAIRSLEAGVEIKQKETKAIGCSIKWKK